LESGLCSRAPLFPLTHLPAFRMRFARLVALLGSTVLLSDPLLGQPTAAPKREAPRRGTPARRIAPAESAAATAALLAAVLRTDSLVGIAQLRGDRVLLDRLLAVHYTSSIVGQGYVSTRLMVLGDVGNPNTQTLVWDQYDRTVAFHDENRAVVRGRLRMLYAATEYCPLGIPVPSDSVSPRVGSAAAAGHAVSQLVPLPGIVPAANVAKPTRRYRRHIAYERVYRRESDGEWRLASTLSTPVPDS
jgi:hypothetical protein